MRGAWTNLFYLAGLACLLCGCGTPAARPPVYVAAPAPKPLSAAEVKALARAGVSDDNIISQIYQTHSVYRLDADAIIDLRHAGVPEKVIAAMINSGNAPFGAAGTPAAPGPGYVWVAGEWNWDGHVWVWTVGTWVSPPYPRAVWMPGGWGFEPNGRRHWVPGHWR